ncbi:MAG TPA: MFS transporter, partial [Thermoanaerobaculia bacterium]|nr:MFS transporter [Thermoanaerobaculia bacterium]
IGTAVYRGAMTQVIPNGLSSAESQAVRGTLGGAMAIAQQLPTHLGAALVGTAREAFIQALHLTSYICAFVVLATAVAVVVLLRNR